MGHHIDVLTKNLKYHGVNLKMWVCNCTDLKFLFSSGMIAVYLQCIVTEKSILQRSLQRYLWGFAAYFLAHVWALTMTCCPSSVSREHFVTAGSIDLKLCTYVPLDEMTLRDQISVRSDSWLGHQDRQEAKTENAKSAITPELMPGSSPNFYHRYI
jgi:hypothetical protein